LKQADKSSLEIDGKNPVIKGVEDGRVGNRQQLNFWVSRYNKNPLADFMAPQADSAAFCGGVGCLAQKVNAKTYKGSDG
jgi:hypothetical protein